jgi:hypothetical protein
MQIARIMREVGNPARQVFFSPMELTAWLGEMLTIPERTRLETFLREGEQIRARKKTD